MKTGKQIDKERETKLTKIKITENELDKICTILEKYQCFMDAAYLFEGFGDEPVKHKNIIKEDKFIEDFHNKCGYQS